MALINVGDSGAFQVNQIIQKAARLRLGKSKNVVISECRNSIKANNINQLIKVIAILKIKVEETLKISDRIFEMPLCLCG